MISIFIIIGKVILEYIFGSLILGFIIVSAQYRPSVNFPRQFVIKSNKRLMQEVLVASLIIFIVHIGFTVYSGEIFFIDDFLNIIWM